MAKIRTSQVRLKKGTVGVSPSSRALAQFSLCKNNREFKLEEIVQQFEDLKSITSAKIKVQAMNRDILGNGASRRNINRNAEN